jgi:hypothetical protein
VTRHLQRFPGSRPIGLPRTCGRHGWCSGPWAFPRAPHPAGREPATHVTAGTGRTQPVAMSPASAGPPRLAHSLRATSCRKPGSPGALLHRGPLRTTHARSRARGPSKPRRAVHTALKVLRRIRRTSAGGPPVRSPRCSTCPSVPASAPLSLQRLTCPRQRPCGHEHQARYPASYTSTFREETRPCGARFPVAFQPPAFAFWAPCPARDFRPSYDRPTAAPAHFRACTTDPGEVSTFRTHETRPGRTPSLPRGQRCSPAMGDPWPSPAASQRLVPAIPAMQSSPGC